MTKGKISRAEYLDRSLSRRQPWVAEGISRRTWERRRKLQHRDASPYAASPEQAAVASPADDARRLDEARASVAKIYEQMAAERERRLQWWRAPVEGWPDQIVIRNIVRDEAVTVRLDGDEKRERKLPAQAPRPWWDPT
jgi:hypothetical protein